MTCFVQKLCEKKCQNPFPAILREKKKLFFAAYPKYYLLYLCVPRITINNNLKDIFYKNYVCLCYWFSVLHDSTIKSCAILEKNLGKNSPFPHILFQTSASQYYKKRRSYIVADNITFCN